MKKIGMIVLKSNNQPSIKIASNLIIKAPLVL